VEAYKEEEKKMKALLRIVTFVLVMFVVTSTFAAGTIVAVKDDFIASNVRRVEFLCTHSAAPAFSVSVDATTSGLSMQLIGWKVDFIEVKPGGVAPTTDTDLTIINDFGMDILAGLGANIVDDVTARSTFASLDGTTSYEYPIMGTLTMATTNNAVASATFIIRFNLSR